MRSATGPASVPGATVTLMRRPWPGPGVAALACLVLAACSAPGPSYVDLPIQRTPASLTPAHCPDNAAGYGLPGPSSSTTPAAGSVPAGFQSRTVLRCRADPTRAQDDPSRITVVQETAPITPALMSAIGLPDQDFARGRWGSTYACADASLPPPFVLLIDGRGSAVRPVLPQGPCATRPEVDQAMNALEFTTVRTFTVRIG